MARKTAAQVERGAYRAKRRALVRKAEKKPPSGAAFKGARAAHIGYCTSECWHAQVQGQYTVEVKQKSASGGSRRPKPWAKYYILDRGNYACIAFFLWPLKFAVNFFSLSIITARDRRAVVGTAIICGEKASLQL